MDDRADILISIQPQYVEQLLSGAKTVELRRRAVRILPGTRVWIYSTKPHGVVEAVGIVASTHEYTPSKIWRDFGPRAGVSRPEFDHYFRGVDKGCVIVFRQIVRLERSLSLTTLRSALGRFLPPQFFRVLRSGGRELRLFQGSVEAECLQA